MQVLYESAALCNRHNVLTLTQTEQRARAWRQAVGASGHSASRSTQCAGAWRGWRAQWPLSTRGRAHSRVYAPQARRSISSGGTPASGACARCYSSLGEPAYTAAVCWAGDLPGSRALRSAAGPRSRMWSCSPHPSRPPPFPPPVPAPVLRDPAFQGAAVTWLFVCVFLFIRLSTCLRHGYVCMYVCMYVCTTLPLARLAADCSGMAQARRAALLM